MAEVVRIEGASIVRQHNNVLAGVDWVISEDERWVVIGPNGAGKTTVVSLVAARTHPSKGSVSVLGEQVTKASIRDLRVQVGVSSDAIAQRIASGEVVRDVVVTAAYGVTTRALEQYDAGDIDRAEALLAAFGLQDFADREYGTLSEGERKRVQIARALMSDPEILVLDEPGAGLDLVGREELLDALGELASSPTAPVMILVTHHVDEIPTGFTHALLMRDGAVVAAGPIDQTLTSANLSEAYGTPLVIERSGGRWRARRG